MKKLLPFLIILALISCKKEGTGGKAGIRGAVEHHHEKIPNAIVYIKYGATELPGTSPDNYDDKVVADATDASYKFENLKKGDYFLYSVGFDAVFKEEVSGGIAVRVKKKNEKISINIAVTE